MTFGVQRRFLMFLLLMNLFLLSACFQLMKYSMLSTIHVFEMTVFFKVLTTTLKKFKFTFAGLEAFATANLGRIRWKPSKTK